MNIIKESKDAVKIACSALENGQVIAFATDTVYALVCDYSNQEAIDKIYRIKNRDINKRLPIFVNNIEMLEGVAIMNDIARDLIAKSTTVILDAKDHNHGIAVRIPNHRFCIELLNAFNKPIAQTSANISGHKELLNADFSGMDGVDLIIDGGECMGIGVSTIIDTRNGKIEIIRQGNK